jgi:hypothetical protein
MFLDASSNQALPAKMAFWKSSIALGRPWYSVNRLTIGFSRALDVFHMSFGTGSI